VLPEPPLRKVAQSNHPYRSTKEGEEELR